MIVELFITMLLIAFVLTILSVSDRSILYALLGLVLWIMIMAQSLFIVDVGGTSYMEYGISAFSLAFIFTHIILLIVFYMDTRSKHNIV